MPGIIWLASYPKSGNTWLRAFLANYFLNPSEPLPVNDLYKFCYGDGFLFLYEEAAGKPKEELTEDELRQLRPQMHRFIADAGPADKFVKTHNYIGEEGGIPLITPEVTAGAVYVVRNPLDVAISVAHHYQVDFDRAIEILNTPHRVLYGDPDLQLPDIVGTWTQHVRSWTEAPGLNPHVIRYEDMQAKPGPTFRALAKFLGVPVEPKRLRRAVRFASFDSLAGQEQTLGFNEARPDGAVRFFRRGQSGQWREYLTQDQTDRVIATHSDTMRRFGYLDKKHNPS